MSVIAISDTFGSLGSEIGRAVASVLGYEFADREIITKAAERFGGEVAELTRVRFFHRVRNRRSRQNLEGWLRKRTAPAPPVPKPARPPRRPPPGRPAPPKPR